MKKVLLAAILLFPSLYLHAQKSDISFGAGATYSYFDNANANYKRFTDVLIAPAFSIRYSYQICEHFSLSTGLDFVCKGAKGKGDLRDTHANLLNTVNIYNHLYYFVLPLQIGYKFEGVISIIPKIGFSLDYLYHAKAVDLQTTTYLTEFDESFGSLNKWNQLSISTIASIEFRKRINKTFSLKFEPEYSRTIANISKNSLKNIASLNPYYFGANLGCVVDF